MAIFKKVVESGQEEYDGFFVIDEISKANAQKQKAENDPKYKGLVANKKVTFPEELGEQHPFDYAATEGIYKKFGFANGVVDKYIDFIVGSGFYVTCNDDRGTKLLTTFLKDVNFDTVLRAWIKEALTKDGFLELGGGKDEVPKGLKVLDAKWMYVDRDNKGKVKKFNQYVGGFEKYSKTKVQPFESYQIAHLSLNKIGDSAYGMGIIYPALQNIENLLQNQNDLHMLMKRKANAPYHVKLGGVVGGKYYKASAATTTKWGGDLDWLTNKHEWVTDGLTEIKSVDFGNIGEKFQTVLDYDVNQLFYTWQVPSVLMGTGNINEGIAKVQMEAFRKRIESLQQEIEKVIENDILKRVLIANGLGEIEVEFEWGQPSLSEKNERLLKITELLKSPMVSDSLKKLLEMDVVQLMGYDVKDFESMSEEEEKKRELERKQPLVPGQNAKLPSPVNQSLCLHDQKSLVEGFSKYKTIDEWLGFSYGDYKENIIEFLSSYDFSYVAAINSVEETAGKFNSVEIKKLREVLKEGFVKEKSVKEIVADIKKKVNPKDLLKIENGSIVKDDAGVAKVVLNKEYRPEIIARSEITRAANEGALLQYRKNGIEKVQWITSAGTRTCALCAPLDGNVYGINSHPEIPVHPNCRCTLIPVSEVI